MTTNTSRTIHSRLENLGYDFGYRFQRELLTLRGLIVGVLLLIIVYADVVESRRAPAEMVKPVVSTEVVKPRVRTSPARSKVRNEDRGKAFLALVLAGASGGQH